MIFSNYPEQVNGGALPVKAKFGMRIGVVADLGISRHFYIDPALLYVMNGDNVNYVFENDIVRVNTLQLPVNVVYKSGHPGGERFVIGAGPYFARNMSGTRKVGGNGATTSISVSIGNDAAADNLRPTDIGLGALVGYELTTGLYVRAYFQHGFTNLQPGGDAGNSLYNLNYGVNVGYLFGGHGSAHAKKEQKGKSAQP